MFQKFQNHLTTSFSFLENKKLLLAISGGIDSMVLIHLFQKLNYEISIAHCNFQLRGVASFDDQKFIQEYAEANNILIFVNQFDTQNFAKDHKLSTQVAARNLRYSWFYELLEEEKYDYILTAHHADDNLETFIINLSRGTGLDGLVGIPALNANVVRPLLIFSRHEIEEYAKTNNINWREDSSNASDNYLRNTIRHNVIPELKKIDSKFLNSFQKSQSYLQESQSLVADAVSMMYQNVATEVDEEVHFDINVLKKLSNFKSYLYQFLKEYGFTAWNDIYDLIDAQSGKIIYSNDYQIVKNRNHLILAPISEVTNAVFLIEKNQTQLHFPVKLSFQKVNKISNTDENTIFVNQDRLTYPLEIRKWREGEYILPFGMNGKSKKVSKFFKDQKISVLEKQAIWILYSNNEIVWILGLRQDERFRIDDNTQNKLQITLI